MSELKAKGKIEFDSATIKWFKTHPDAVVTTRSCDKCGLYYKSGLKHKCKVEQEGEQ